MRIRYTELEEHADGPHGEELRSLFTKLLIELSLLRSDAQRTLPDRTTGETAFKPEVAIHAAVIILQIIADYPEFKPVLGLVTAATILEAQRVVHENTTLDAAEKTAAKVNLGQEKLAELAALGVPVDVYLSLQNALAGKPY